MISVLVVPEIEKFKLDVSHEGEIWISHGLGKPDLAKHKAKYVAPYWIPANDRGVHRIFHIKNAVDVIGCFVITLGNSFILEKVWDNIGQTRRFEYHKLDDFDLKEVMDGVLIRKDLVDTLKKQFHS